MRGNETDGDVLVRTEVQQPGGYPIPINYSLYRANNGWKVYDVVIDNISLVTNYRASFANEIRKSGIDGLIANLQQRNQGGK
jgi:phospholipid transport system substrate-binding protein